VTLTLQTLIRNSAFANRSPPSRLQPPGQTLSVKALIYHRAPPGRGPSQTVAMGGGNVRVESRKDGRERVEETRMHVLGDIPIESKQH
ncbi:hypothetical protein KUCAC02_017058, partial [Chaenocephalus aceratus]